MSPLPPEVESFLEVIASTAIVLNNDQTTTTNTGTSQTQATTSLDSQDTLSTSLATSSSDAATSTDTAFTTTSRSRHHTTHHHTLTSTPTTPVDIPITTATILPSTSSTSTTSIFSLISLPTIHPSITLLPATTSPTPFGQPGISNASVAGIASGIAAGAVLLLLSILYFLRRRHRHQLVPQEPNQNGGNTPPPTAPLSLTSIFIPAFLRRRATNRSTRSRVYPESAWLYDATPSPARSVRRAGTGRGVGLGIGGAGGEMVEERSRSASGQALLGNAAEMSGALTPRVSGEGLEVRELDELRPRVSGESALVSPIFGGVARSSSWDAPMVVGSDAGRESDFEDYADDEEVDVGEAVLARTGLLEVGDGNRARIVDGRALR